MHECSKVGRGLVCGALMASALSGCGRESVSVGDAECSAIVQSDVSWCAPPESEQLASESITSQLGAEGVAKVLWKLPMSPCGASDAPGALLAHPDGSLTFAVVTGDDPRVWGDRIAITRVSATGEKLFETAVPVGDGGALEETGLARAADGGDLLWIITRVRIDSPTPTRLHTARITADGEVQERLSKVFESYDVTKPVWLDDGGFVASYGRYADSALQVARHTPDGDLSWQQTRAAYPGTKAKLQLQSPMFTSATQWSIILDMAVDSRGHIWAAVNELVSGFIELDADGTVMSHQWAALTPSDDPWSQNNSVLDYTATPTVAIDRRDRAIFGIQDSLVRIESKESGYVSQLVNFQRESFYTQWIDSLAVDDRNRIYVGTQDGALSAHRIVIDRLSEDLTQRERFVLQLPTTEMQDYRLAAMQLGEDDTVHAHLVYRGMHPQDNCGQLFARLQLVEPDSASD